MMILQGWWWRSVRYRAREAVQWWVAMRTPRWLVYLCTIRCGAAATSGRWSDQDVPELRLMDAVKRWEKPGA